MKQYKNKLNKIIRSAHDVGSQTRDDKLNYLFIYLVIFHLDKRCYQRLELDVKLKMCDDKNVEILLLICKQLPSLIWNSKTKTSTYFLIDNTLS